MRPPKSNRWGTLAFLARVLVVLGGGCWRVPGGSVLFSPQMAGSQGACSIVGGVGWLPVHQYLLVLSLLARKLDGAVVFKMSCDIVSKSLKPHKQFKSWLLLTDPQKV